MYYTTSGILPEPRSFKFMNRQMTIRQAIESVLDLQSEWTSANSSPMQQRGELIRKELTGQKGCEELY